MCVAKGVHRPGILRPQSENLKVLSKHEIGQWAVALAKNRLALSVEKPGHAIINPEILATPMG